MSSRSSPPRPPADPRPLDEHRASRERVTRIFLHIWNALGRRRVPCQERHDLTQEVLLAALESWPRYDTERGPPEKWLNGIILNHYRRWRARCASDPVLLGQDEAEPRDDAAESAEDLAIFNEKRRLARQLYEEIPVEYRDAMIAHELEELTFEEIAETRGFAVSTAHYYVQMGMTHFRAALGRWKARHRDRGVLLLPITVKALFDADRTSPDPPAAGVEAAWRRVQRKLGETAPDADLDDGGGTAPASEPGVPDALSPTAAAAAPLLPVLTALIVGLIAGAWIHSLFRTTRDPIVREDVPPVTASPLPSVVAILPAPSVVASVVRPEPPPKVAPPVATAPAADVDGDEVTAELAAFDTARAAFAQGNLGAAIRALDEHAQRFPRGKTASERDRMRIEALARLGRRTEACRRAASFRRAYPKSEYLQHLDTLCPMGP